MTEFRRILLDGVVTEISRNGDSFTTADGRIVDVSTVSHLPPSVPTKIICVHLSYSSRVQELDGPATDTPTYFHKPVSCLNSHKGVVLRPLGCQYLNYESEVAIIIGRRARSVSLEDAASYIAGYSIALDFGLHDFRDTDANSMLRVKGSDTLGVVGPGISTDWNPRGKRITTTVNGRIVQDDNVDGMLWSMPYFVADLARSITLEPGDIILTGTPAHSRPVEPGDVVVASVEGLGELECRIESGTRIPVEFGAPPSDSQAIRGVALGTGLSQ